MPQDFQTDALSRRHLLGAMGAGAVGMLATRAGLAAETSAAATAFRFVHLTDIHVQPELKAGEGFRQCMRVVHELKPRPDFILTGGDLVMDVLAQDAARAKAVFDLYTSICQDSDIPIRQCIGNHDVFGWSSKGKIAPDHVSYGKKMAQERLGLDRTTYSFDHKGWHFCVVDDIQPLADAGYEGGFSREDMAWLDKDLASAGNRPKVICTHIPIITVTQFRSADAKDERKIGISTGMMCRNAGAILKLLRERSVNLVLTGHAHQNESLRFDGTTHIEDGAVCGSWWKGPHFGNPEGFGVIDVRSDGTFEHAYRTYGWHAEAAPKKG